MRVLGSETRPFQIERETYNLPVPVVFPEQSLYFAVPQPHERRNCEGRCCGLREQCEDGLNLLQRVGIRFLRLCGLWVDGRIAGGVFPLEIILLLCQSENSADYALDVFQSVAAQLARSNLIQPALNVVRPRVLQPNLLARAV